MQCFLILDYHFPYTLWCFCFYNLNSSSLLRLGSLESWDFWQHGNSLFPNRGVRSYQVTWRRSTSALRRLCTGVPQGLVLGPLQFSVYIQSLVNDRSSHGFSYSCYADDTQFILPQTLMFLHVSQHVWQISHHGFPMDLISWNLISANWCTSPFHAVEQNSPGCLNSWIAGCLQTVTTFSPST